MKKLLITLALACAAMFASAEELKWLTNATQAQTQAKSEKKVVFLNFTGSDWCGWCIKLNKEVFSTPEFAEYARKHLVLVEVDFPRRKQLTPEQKKANTTLAAKYKIRGYPTIIVLDGDGRQLGELGYVRGGPKAFLAELEKVKKKAA